MTLSSRSLLAIFLVALLVRGVMLAATLKGGEMEGLAWGYEHSAYSLVAGYGYVRSVADEPHEVDLPRLVEELAARGERLTPANAPRIDPARWRPLSLHPPGYSVFLATLYRTLGPPATLWARLLQLVADAAACLVIAMIGARFAGPWVGRFAGFGAAVFLPAVFVATSRIADSACVPLYVFFFAAFLRALDRREWFAWAGAGALAGILFQLRPDYALAPPLFAGVAWLLLPRRRATFAGALLMFAVMGLFVLPWAMRNQQVIGRFTPGTTSAGMSMLMSVGQFANPYGVSPQDGWYQKEARRRGFESFDDPAADRMFRERYVAIARENPGLIASGMLKRVALAAATPYHFGYENPHYAGHGFYEYHDREQLGHLATVRKYPREILRAYWDRFLFVPVALVLFAATVAAPFVVRRGKATAILLALPWVYLVLVHLTFFLTTRMLVPGVFAQILCLGIVVARLRGRVTELAVPGDA